MYKPSIFGIPHDYGNPMAPVVSRAAGDSLPWLHTSSAPRQKALQRQLLAGSTNSWGNVGPIKKHCTFPDPEM